ncbi:MAG TPA: hypothetical protein VN451_09645, partial [Chitinophagaceae bacterium]|nr:hypothetical protein [Chitinophagaceae bacterium]
TLLLAGCFETTQVLTINEDGTGTYENTSDMGSILSIAKNMGAAGNDKMPVKVMDSSFSMASMAEKIAGLSEEEKALLQRGAMNVKMNLDDEVMKTSMSFSFTNADDIQKFNHLAGKVMMESVKSQLPEDMPMGADQLPAPSSFDDYYNLEVSKDEMKRKLNKDKYSGVNSDEFLNGLKQAGSMGIPVTTTYIINLPRPAEKVEGKNAKLSEDKMKVTITAGMDDFFDNPESLEFKIKF